MKIRLHLALVIACMSASISGAFPLHGAEPVTQVQLRQRIIRVPEDALVQALEAKPNDEALSKQLLEWVASGKARVVSDLTTPANPRARFDVKDGKVYRWVTENDQDFSKPVLTPTAWEDIFLGVQFEGENHTEPLSSDAPEPKPGENVPADPFSPTRVIPSEMVGGRHALKVVFSTKVRAPMATKVEWPLVWPENRKPEVGTYLQDDFLLQELITDALLQPGRENVVAFLSPATDMESKPTLRELDVVLMHPDVGKTPTPPAAANTNESFPPAPRVHLYGFGVNDREAVALLATRPQHNDAALLAKLQSMARDGKAIRRLVCGSQTSYGNRGTLSSVREHSYPTEMPSIPSAWETRPMGTRLEMELIDRMFTLSLEIHPARFRWMEWCCALDAPQLIMRQPQFFSQKVETSILFPKDNVVLVSAMRTPECLAGWDKGPVIGETLLVFAELDQPKGSPPLPSWTTDPPPVHVDLETLVFELPAMERDAWKRSGENQPVDDEQRYQLALSRVKDGTAKVVCHLATSTRSGNRAVVHTIEEARYITEYNPVDHNPICRYRPTALEMRPVGSKLEIDSSPIDAGGFAGSEVMIPVNLDLQHDALPLVQPMLAPSLKYSLTHSYRLPEPIFITDRWRESVHLLSGKARCLGSVRPKAVQFQDRIHVAFVRGTVRK